MKCSAVCLQLGFTYAASWPALTLAGRAHSCYAGGIEQSTRPTI